MKIKKSIKLLAFLLTFALIVSSFASISAFADDAVTFNFSDSEFGSVDDHIKTQSLSSGSITLPSSYSNNGAVKINDGRYRGYLNITGWIWDKDGKYYKAGTTLNNVPAGSVFTAVFGNESYDFNNLSSVAIYTSGNGTASYGSDTATVVNDGTGNLSIKFDGSGKSDYMATVIPITKPGSNVYMAGFNKGVKYKVSFKYKRTDTTDTACDLYVNFGASAFNDWRTGQSKCVSSNKVGTTKTGGMSEYETVTAWVTAPDTYVNGTDGSSRCIAVGAKISDGVVVQIDDVKIESALADSFVKFSYGNCADADFGGEKVDIVDYGTVTMPDKTQDCVLIKRTNTQNRGKAHITAWMDNNTGVCYPVGQTVENVPGGTLFTPVFGDDFYDFNGNGITPGMTVYRAEGSAKDTTPSFGADVASIVELESGNNCVQFDGNSSYSNNTAMFTPGRLYTGSGNYVFTGYNLGAQYKVSFKYRRTDTQDKKCKLYVSFGTGVFSDWLASSRCISNVEVGTTKGGMSDFETVTALVTAPDTYTYQETVNSSLKTFYSRSVGFSVDIANGIQIQIDDFKVEALTGKTDYAYFMYNGNGAVSAIGNNNVEFADNNGDITLPTDISAKNLLWKNGDDYYLPGDTVNVSELTGNTFNAVFGGVTQNFENISVDKFDFADGKQKNKTLYQELTRNSYWQVPAKWSNYQAGSNYGTALGHDRMGIVSGVGNSGKGLKFTIDDKYSSVQYVNAALFSHNPTSFGTNDSIDYSYVYYTPGKEYTMEFDYKASADIDVAIAFGIDTMWSNANCGTKSVSMSDFDANHITLDASDSWQHASVTVTAPDSYTGNGVTSARVGIAVKDSEAWDGSNSRYNYFDNISFYPTDLGRMEFNFGGLDEGEFINSPLHADYNANGFTAPLNKTSTATFLDGGSWTVSRGDTLVDGWICDQNGKYYAAGSRLDIVPNATYSAVYGNNSADFNDLPTSGFTIYDSKNNNISYGSARASIVANGDNNNCIRLAGANDDAATLHQMAVVKKIGSNYRILGFNKGTKYKVTFKYKRTDNTDADSDLYFAFGMMTLDWRSTSKNISKVKIASTNKNMSEFETVSAIVTAPDTYFGTESGYSSKAIGVAATLSNGVEILIDDFEIESAIGNSYVTFDKNIGENEATHEMLQSGENMTDLPELTYDGFEFCGWYDNRMGNGSEITSVFGNGETINLFAKWVPALSGSTGNVTINGSALSNYQVVLPTNKTLVLADTLKEFKTFITGKGATTSSKSLKINIEDTSSKVATNGSSYTIKVENNNLNVTATDDAAMAGAIQRLTQFIKTAYDKNKTLNFASDFEFTQKYVADDSQYSYSWSDEFTGEDLDKSIWLNNAGYRDCSVSGYQIKTGSSSSIKNKDNGRYNVNSAGVFVDNGSAVIRAEKVDQPDGNGNNQYFLGRSMSTIGSVQYTYGCIEIKAKLPSHPAAPSIWLYSSQNIDTTAEIDLHEGIGEVSGYANNQQIVSNLHASYHLSSSNNKWKTALDKSQPMNSGAASGKRIYLGTTKTNFDNDYHIFSVKWTPDGIKFALDGEVYYSYDFNSTKDLINNAETYDGSSPFSGLTAAEIKDCFSKPVYVCFGNTMGSYEGSYGPVYENGDPTQADLKVDYVRIYQSKANAGTQFQNKPYTVSEIAEVEQQTRTFLAENGIEDRGSTTKTVAIGNTSVKINYGDYLPVNYEIGSQYVYGWTDGTNEVKTYKDTSKTYTPLFINRAVLDTKYKVANVSGDKCDLLLTATVDSQYRNFVKAGFVYSLDGEASPKIGTSKYQSIETTNVYADGLFANQTEMFNCTTAGYTGSAYMFNGAIGDIATTGRTKDICIRSFVVLPDGRVIYGDTLTIASSTTLSSNVEGFDCFIAQRLANNAKLDNIGDYNNDGCTNLIDLVRLKKMAAKVVDSDEEVNSTTLASFRVAFLTFDNSKVLSFS